MASIAIDYTSKDFDGFKASLLAYAAQNWPDYAGVSEADFGVMMVELFSYLGDILSYYGDRIQTESFINTATQRQSVLNLAGLLGYVPAGRIPATGTVTVSNSSGVSVDIPALTQFLTTFIPQYDSQIFFESNGDNVVPPNGSLVIAVTEGQSRGSTAIILYPGSLAQQTVYVENLGTADGTLDQVFSLADYPVIDGSMRIFADDTDPSTLDTVVEYQHFNFLLDAGPNDRAYTYSRDATGIVTVQFGDGVNGFVVPSGSRVYAYYRVGGGARGNILANSILDVGTSIPNITITASSAMTGGADEENIDTIRTNAPLSYQTQDRAVTLNDYANLAVGVASISKASAVANTYSNVTVFVLGGGGQPANQALLDATKAYLDARKMAGTTVTILNGTSIGVNIGTSISPVTIGVNSRYVNTSVKQSVTQAITSFFDPSVGNFGSRISVSDLYTTIAQVPGVDYAIIPMMARTDAVQSGVADAIFQPWEIAILGTLYITASGGIT